MSPVDVVKTFITALQAGEMEEAARFMADDFVERGWTPQPLDGQTFLAMMSALHNALPDFSYHLSEPSERGEEVEALISVAGTHTRDLALPEFGLPLIPYSGVAIQLPQVHATFRVKEDAIAEMLVEALPGGGLSGLLQQIDAELPILPRLGNKDIQRLNESGDTTL
ncbi:MAG TPA: nuclear transport factor 2 family protein [Ktedonobacteraceae bacterium]